MSESRMTPVALYRSAVTTAERASDSAARQLLAAAVWLSYRRVGTIAIMGVALFYAPAFLQGSDILMGGDTLGWYLPALAKTHALIHSLKFTAMDFSSFNGSSDFFVSPNFFQYHPLVVLFSLLMPETAATVPRLGLFLTAMLAVHSWIAFYFGMRMFTRFFAMELGAAVLAGAMFAFSPYMMNAKHSPPFFFSATIVPWVVYGALSYGAAPTLRTLLLSSLPVVFGFTAGYLPLGVGCLALSAVVVAAHILAFDRTRPLDERLRRLVCAAAPFMLASAVMSLYLYAIWAFHRETSSSTIPSLFYSAHQLGDLPQSILRVFSTHFVVPGPFYEFSLSWGIVAVVVAALFVFTPRAALSLPLLDWNLLRVAACIYFVTVLCTFGQYSPVSDLVFYFVPQVGKMHIYQRFLLPAHLLFAALVAVMLRGLVDTRPPVATRIAVAVLGIAALAAAYAAAFHPTEAQKAGVDNYVVFELGLGFLFALALLVPGRGFVFASATVLATLPMLDRMYDGSLAHAAYDNQIKDRVALDPGKKAPFVAWLKQRFPDRDVIKYADITPMWTAKGVETFPKVFPFFALSDIRLSSYGGFTFYLSSRADYMRHMPVGGDVQLLPDWDYLAKSGADFVVARTQDLQGPLAALALSVDPKDVYRLPNDVVVVPLRGSQEPRSSADGSRYDNGMIRVTVGGAERATLRPANIALGKPARQSGDGGGAAGLAVDGNTNGDFAAGSVTHTARDPNAWLEVDLGSVERVDAIRIWNRTDAGGHRLRDYWVIVSEHPFLPADTVARLRARPDTWSHRGFTPSPSTTIETGGVRARYVRIQFDGRQPLEESYLTIAELEVLRYTDEDLKHVAQSPKGTVTVSKFDTDFAQRARLDFETDAPATVDYLFWDNPRLAYYVDGIRVVPQPGGALRTFRVGPGKHTFEVHYRHWPLKLFWLIYGMYGLALIAAVWTLAVRRRQSHKQVSTAIQE